MLLFLDPATVRKLAAINRSRPSGPSNNIIAATAACVAFIGTLLISVPQAQAHGGVDFTEGAVWSAWSISLDIALPTIALLLVYVWGARRRSDVGLSKPRWRHLAFLGGVASIVIALQSPIDPLAERLFFVHQIQHFLLRMLGPMLIALSWPSAFLIAGLPRSIRKTILVPILSSPPLRRGFGMIGHPTAATILFIGVLYFWEVPRYHDAALSSEPLHYLMHVSMLAVGLLFWWKIFDPRPDPKGWPFGLRLMTLLIVILSNIGLGSYTVLKAAVLYPAYDVNGRMYGFSGIADEQFGGLIIWIPSSMMCLLALLLTIHAMGLNETRREATRLKWTPSNSAAMDYPTTGAALIEKARPKNKAMALGFSIFSISMFLAAIGIGVLA
tara:strand:- start:2283 stop:3437 length:1155 start_codon:yes stop_codon:yes gene_type:complete